MIVVYRIGFFSYWLGRFVVNVPFISLVNLVLGRGVVPELIQSRAQEGEIAREALGILGDSVRREAMRFELAGLRKALGASGASARAASEVAVFLEGDSA
jgi:lipid-A-disaccharide synthase